MSLIKFISLTMVFAGLLSGCNSVAVNPSQAHAGYLLLEHSVLSRVPSDADIDVRFVSTSGEIHKESLSGGASLPVRIPIKTVDQQPGSDVVVNITVEGTTVLKGKVNVTPNSENRIELTPAVQVPLADSYWRAIDIAGRGIPPTVQTTLAFDARGALSGHAGCNHYRSEFVASAVFLEVGEARLTRQICAGPVMFHENRYLQLLTASERVAIDNEGILSLYIQGKEKPIKYVPATQQEVNISMRAF